jgi:predicted enzyme related to lactoylglutathione lyase
MGQGSISVTLPANTGTVLLVGKKGEKLQDGDSLKAPISAQTPERSEAAEQESEKPGKEASQEAEKPQASAATEEAKSQPAPGQGLASAHLSGLTVMVENLDNMVQFYKNALGFSLEQQGDRAYLERDGVELSFYGRRKFEQLTCRGYGYGGGVTGHFHIRIQVEDACAAFSEILSKGASGIKETFTSQWGEVTAYVADPEGNVIELLQSK